MKRILLAALTLIMISSNAFAETELTDEQYEVLGTSLRINLITKACPFAENKRELGLWAIKANLTPAMMDSGAAELFLLEVVGKFSDEVEKHHDRAGCRGWWNMFGENGSDHANLLLKQ